MTGPLKLTDDVIAFIELAVECHKLPDEPKSRDVALAIRALRDAARAVCDAAKLADSRLSLNGWDAIRDLRDLLPDEPKGGGL